MNDVKSIFASKTFWINALTVGIAAITGASGAQWVQDNPQVTSTLIAAIGMMNIVLRWMTTTTVTIVGK